MKKALCVGIDCYEYVDDLHGCVNDANSIKAALERNGDNTLNFQVKIMCATSEAAYITRSELKDAIDNHKLRMNRKYSKMTTSDILDMTQDEYIEVLIRRADGEEWLLEIDKEYDEDLGIEFENGLMDDYRSCSNRCIFCFIDQMPPGMRETLYFKDDDTRLSFLQAIM